jgi:plastocyanin
MTKLLGTIVLACAVTFLGIIVVTDVVARSIPTRLGSRPAPAEIDQPASTSGAERVNVRVGNSMSFTPSSIVVKAGEPVELTLTNEGAIPHTFTIMEGVSRPVNVEAGGGQTSRATFTLDQPGTYTFICAISGHLAAGMKGTIRTQ